MLEIKTAPFVKEMCDTAANMYRLGWDERNGGNISYLLDEDTVAKYLDLQNVIRTIPIGFAAEPLIGKIFIVTGTGKYFKNVKEDPENNLGIIRIAKDGCTAELLWGYRDGGKFTSELPAHLMSHMARLRVDPENRVVMHSHPTNTLAMNYVHELDEKKMTHTLWEMCTMDETFGLIETVEKAAQIYMLTAHLPRVNTIRDTEMQSLAEYFGVDYRKDFLNL